MTTLPIENKRFPNLTAADRAGFDLLLEELNRARGRVPDRFSSAYEGFAVLMEEVDKLWEEVKSGTRTRGWLTEETIQVAVMALRIFSDVCSLTNPTTDDFLKVMGEADATAENFYKD